MLPASCRSLLIRPHLMLPIGFGADGGFGAEGGGWGVRAEGEVGAGREGTGNEEMATGQVEVVARAIEVLSEAEPPPFPLDDRVEVDEVVRLRHRYLDLRRAPMQRNLRLRAA